MRKKLSLKIVMLNYFTFLLFILPEKFSFYFCIIYHQQISTFNLPLLDASSALFDTMGKIDCAHFLFCRHPFTVNSVITYNLCSSMLLVHSFFLLFKSYSTLQYRMLLCEDVYIPQRNIVGLE